MKSLVLPALFLIISSAPGIASEIRVGDSTAQVRLTLGAPRGEVHAGSREVFYYDRGEVEVRDGVVKRVSLRSEEEQSALEARRSAEATRIRNEREIREAGLAAEGDALKARKLGDPGFLGSPLSRQLAFWQDFSRRYPGSPCAVELDEVRARFALENEERQKQLEQARRLADLEARVTAAENEARLGRQYDYERRQFAIGYPTFGGFTSYRHARDYCPAPPSVKPVTRMYEFPLPYATSPGMPPMQPVFRKDYSTDPVNETRLGDGMQNARSSASSYRRF